MIRGCADKSLDTRTKRRNKQINSALPDSLNVTAVERQLHASESMNRFRPILAGWCLRNFHQTNGKPLFTRYERFSCAHPATESSKIERPFFFLLPSLSLSLSLSLPLSVPIDVSAWPQQHVMRNMQIGPAVLPVVPASTHHHHHHHHHHRSHHRRRRRRRHRIFVS